MHTYVQCDTKQHIVQLESAMRLYCNKAAINIAHNPVHRDRTKHMDVDKLFIKKTMRF